jgi:hypothetical protein
MGEPGEQEGRGQQQGADRHVTGRHVGRAQRPDDLRAEENLQREQGHEQRGAQAHQQRRAAVGVDAPGEAAPARR